MKQKYPRGTRVKIADYLGEHMTHFDSGVEAIVSYTYAERYPGGDFKTYSLVLLDKEGKPYNAVAWYDEQQLTLISDNLLEGMEIIETYNLR